MMDSQYYHYLIGLGSNLGDRLMHIRTACEALDQVPHCSVIGKSRVYETASWGEVDAPAYLNACVKVRSRFEPLAMLGVCLGIEAALGRERVQGQPFAPRTIDLDILFCLEREHHSDILQIPHPRLHQRAFALMPALDVTQNVQLQTWFDTPDIQKQRDTIVPTALLF